MKKYLFPQSSGFEQLHPSIPLDMHSYTNTGTKNKHASSCTTVNTNNDHHGSFAHMTHYTIPSWTFCILYLATTFDRRYKYKAKFCSFLLPISEQAMHSAKLGRVADKCPVLESDNNVGAGRTGTAHPHPAVMLFAESGQHDTLP